MLERRMVAGAVAYSAVFLGDQVEVRLKNTTVPLGPVNRSTPWSKYMAQSPKGGLIRGLYEPVHDTCAIYFYPGVLRFQISYTSTCRD